MTAATRGQSHTSESANHSASCSIAYASYAPANWREHIRESLKTLSLCCNTQAKIHVGTIPVRAHQVERVTNLDSHKVSDPGTALPFCVHRRGCACGPRRTRILSPLRLTRWPGNFGVQCYDFVE